MSGMKSVGCWLVTLVLMSGVAAQATDAGTRSHAVKTELGVMVPMRDGVKLATNVFRPDAEGRFPTVMLRTPYGRVEAQGLARLLVPRGMAGVWQDARGRFDSEGEWDPFFNEAGDGHDAVEWIADQPWSNGKVAMVGGSYAGYTQWQAARGQSEHLVGLVPFVSVGDFYELAWVGGALNQAALQMWSTLMTPSRFSVSDFGSFQHKPWAEIFAHFPVVDALDRIDVKPAFYRRWIHHPAYDEYWARATWYDECADMKVSALHVTGWFDILQRDTIQNFRMMRTRGAKEVRDRQWLVVGPWAHQGMDTKVGEVDFGPRAALQLPEVLTAYLEYCFEGNPEWSRRKPVRVFTMGENAWHDYDDWPVPRAQAVSYYLSSEKGANSSSGDGTLSRAPPTSASSFDEFTYDPGNPVPTRGGGNCCWPAVVPWGPYDQSEIEERRDVLVYSTPVLEEDVRVTGPVEVVLWVASSAPDTDFTAKLVDVDPEGFAMNLTDGILRTRYRNSFEEEELLAPGQPVQIKIDVWATSNLFRKGHRIRLEISSSNFPHYSRNTNTGNQPELDEGGVPARQKVFHEARRPSRLILPVLPAEG